MAEKHGIYATLYIYVTESTHIIATGLGHEADVSLAFISSRYMHSRYMHFIAELNSFALMPSNSCLINDKYFETLQPLS